jgi:hypothetical protein
VPHRSRSAVALAAVALAAAACAAEPPPPSGVRVSGRILDSETGLPVPRDHVWVHGFSDDAGAQVSLKPESGDAPFSLDLPTRSVRLRVVDASRKYEVWERTLSADGPSLETDVHLVPTHLVLVHVIVRWRDGAALRPLSDGDGNVRQAMLSFSDTGSGSDVEHAGAGEYSLRLPRKTLRVLVVDTNRHATPNTLDLSGFQGDETTAEFVLEK